MMAQRNSQNVAGPIAKAQAYGIANAGILGLNP
jgi:hypothetical protein